MNKALRIIIIDNLYDLFFLSFLKIVRFINNSKRDEKKIKISGKAGYKFSKPNFKL
tara:strand:+ start:268 stop:435 length:168 start_codon:yes stop_codon:yes gene_type:complete